MATTVFLTAVTTAASNGSSTAEKGMLFGWPDYLVFAISLAIPLAIGVFFFFWKRNEQNGTEDFLVGDRSMNFVAVALSILASLLNGIFVIGTPAEMHYFGTEIALMVVGLFIAIAITAQFFVPCYQTMKFTSAYEYVENRFNYPTRVVASALFCFSVIIFLAVVLYVPALAFSQVTELSIYMTICLTGAICTIYTTIGGMKAVVWTDAVQMVILLVGLIAIAILGSIKVGGGQVVWDIAMSTGRVNFNDIRVDPRIRHTIWTQVIGQGFTYTGLLVANQMMVQRYMSVSSRWQAQAALYIAFLMFVPLVMLIVFIGLTMHASYNSCDPLISKKIKTGDQITPYYILDVLGDYPGVAGLITASVFAAALSSVSSVINALAAVCLEDFISPGVRYFKKTELPERTKRWIAILIVIFFGGVTIGLSFVAQYLTDKVIQATGTIWGVIGGPLAGIFIMGFFMPFCNSAGAISGMIGGLIFSLWVALGNILYAPPQPTLPVGLCRDNLTIILPVKNPNATVNDFPLMDLYRVSYAWYGVIGIGSSVVIGVVVSLLTGGWRRAHIKDIDPAMMNVSCCRCCPAVCVPGRRTVSSHSTETDGREHSQETFWRHKVVPSDNVLVVGFQKLSVDGVLPSKPVPEDSLTEIDKKPNESATANGDPPGYENVAFDSDVHSNGQPAVYANGSSANTSVGTSNAVSRRSKTTMYDNVAFKTEQVERKSVL